MQDLDTEFAAFVTQLRRDGVASELRGCTPDEVAELERASGCRLPYAYRLYLQIMGHSAGRLFTHDHFAVTFEQVLELGEQLRDALSESGSPEAPEFCLPPNALVIVGRLGEQFEYIVCDNPTDSPVVYVSTWDRVAQPAYPSIFAWLRAMHAEAVEAIHDGYYRDSHGTVP